MIWLPLGKVSVIMPPTRWLSMSASVSSLMRSQHGLDAPQQRFGAVHEFGIGHSGGARERSSLQFHHVECSPNSSQRGPPAACPCRRRGRRAGRLRPKGPAVPSRRRSRRRPGHAAPEHPARAARFGAIRPPAPLRPPASHDHHPLARPSAFRLPGRRAVRRAAAARRPRPPARHAAVRLFEGSDAVRAGGLPARLCRPQGADLLRDEGQLRRSPCCRCSRRPAAASTSCPAANSSACWPPAATAADIIFSGVGKTRAEMHQALEAGIGCFNVESEAELEVLSEVAVAAGKVAPVSIRVNPNVDPKTHPYISTGLKGNKFGVAHERTLAAYQRAAALPGLQVVGHRLPHRLADHGRGALPRRDGSHARPGGGDRGRRHSARPHRLRRRPGHRLQRRPAAGRGRALGASCSRGWMRAASATRQFMIEPGRSLVGNAGVCLTEVLYLKPGEQKNFCIVDAAMNDLPRPAMYQAYHAIVPVRRGTAAPQTYDVVGPVCESGDWIGRDRALTVQAGRPAGGAVRRRLLHEHGQQLQHARPGRRSAGGRRPRLPRSASGRRAADQMRCERLGLLECQERAPRAIPSRHAPAGSDAAYTATSAKSFLPARIQKKCRMARPAISVDQLVQHLPALGAQRLDGAVERRGRQRRQQQEGREAHQDERPLGDVPGDLRRRRSPCRTRCSSAGAARRRNRRTAPACGGSAPAPACR